MFKKNTVILLLASCLTATSSFANTDARITDARINTVKAVYAEAFRQIKNTGEYDAPTILYDYGNYELKTAILLNRMSPPDPEGYITQCDNAGYFLHLESGNGISLGEVKDIEFIELASGDVRVLMTYDDVADVKDFALQCDGDDCEITDIYDAGGNSAVDEIMQMCP